MKGGRQGRDGLQPQLGNLANQADERHLRGSKQLGREHFADGTIVVIEGAVRRAAGTVMILLCIVQAIGRRYVIRFVIVMVAV